MHSSLGVSLKQLTHFFNVQKNLYFSLENNKTKKYLYSNDVFSICKKDDSFLLIYSVLFPKFDNLGKEKLLSGLTSKNPFTLEKSELLSSFMSNNFLFNSLVNLLNKIIFTPPVFIFSS
jgi:hypothetical protein